MSRPFALIVRMSAFASCRRPPNSCMGPVPANYFEYTMENTENQAVEAHTALSTDMLEELDNMLEDLRTREDEIPQWEFCDGFLAAVVCTRREIPVAEWLPMLLGDGETLEVAEGQPLPKLDVFKDEAQQARFLELAQLRLAEIREQLDAPIKSLQDEAAFQPEIMDTRGALLLLPEAERAELADEEAFTLVERFEGLGAWLYVCGGKLGRGMGSSPRQGSGADAGRSHGVHRQPDRRRRWRARAEPV